MFPGRTLYLTFNIVGDIMKTHIYADNAATTKLDKEAFDAMVPWLTEEYGNPSQPYSFSRTAKKALADARETITLHQCRSR